MRDRFEMFGIHASAVLTSRTALTCRIGIVAAMIDVEAIRDWTNVFDIERAMRKPGAVDRP